ncbi:MAG: PorT family protein [Sphingobacteriales bacterium]|nr:PorT family protein [Sphingobacteriales bacterium]
MFRSITIVRLSVSIAMLAFLFSSPTHAQYFHGGLLLGANGSQITGDNMLGFNKGGLLMGVFVEHRSIRQERLSLRMEMNYTQKGSRKVLDPYVNVPGIWNLYRADYLEVPIMADFLVYKKWGATGGLALGFNVYENYIDRYGTEDKNFNLAKKTESSLLIGIFYEFSEKFRFFLRYQSSLYNFSIADNTPFWQLWGNRHPGYIHVVASAGIRYYFKPR